MEMLAGPQGEMMRIACSVCRMGGAGVSLSGGMKCGLSCWVGGVAVVAVTWVDQRTRGGGDTVGGCEGDCCLADRSTRGVGTFVGLLVGRRLWTVRVVVLVIGQVHTMCRGGLSIRLMKGLKWGPSCWLLAWTVMLSAMSLFSSSGAQSSKMVNGCYFLCVADGWVVPVVRWLVPWDHLKWWAFELDWAWGVADYYVRRRAAPSVMGLLSAPLFLALWAIVGGAPLVMAYRG